MMERIKKVVGMMGILGLAIVNTGVSQENKGYDKTLSPYFWVKSDDPSTDQLPLKSTSVKVDIAGVIADCKVKQVYKNEGKNTLEAIYVFPGSTRAAVYGMKMTIGERTIVAKIKKREEARKEYEAAKIEGRTASLLEQQRPNVFQMNVANILPGDEIHVEMSYTELLIPTDGVYEFVYPTVVGPRYSNKSEATAQEDDRFVQNPYTKKGEIPSYTFNILVNLSAGMPIEKIACTSHKTDIEYTGKNMAIINLSPSEEKGGNRDYILKYRLTGDNIESGLLLYKADKENFFLLMVQPPKRVEPKEIPSREYIFVVDVSGSMMGFPLNISKKLLRDLIANLQVKDTFNVLLFAGGSEVMAEKSLPATSENIERAIKFIESQRGGGGTELLPALERALALPQSEGKSRTIVIATDGYVDIEKEVFDLIRNNLNDANIFTFGIGTSVNRYIIEGMARIGMGEPMVIINEEEAGPCAKEFRKYIASPVLTDIKIDFDKFNVYDVEPISIPDVFAQRPVLVFGKWRNSLAGNITVTGQSGEGPYRETFDVARVQPTPTNSGLKYLWARHRIAVLGDYNLLQQNDERIEEITNLGLTYNLLTAYTSFVAIDTLVRRDKDGKVITVKQPLPMPEGVPDTAIGDALLSKGFAHKVKTSLFGFGAKKSMSIAPSTEMEVSVTSPSKPYNTYKLGEFLARLVSPEEPRYVKIKDLTLSYEKKYKSLSVELNKKKDQIKKIVNNLLISSTPNIATQKGKEDFRKKLIKEINRILKDGQIKEIYCEILVQ